MGSPKINYPEFNIDEELRETIAELIESVDNGDYLRQMSAEQDIWTLSRSYPSGSKEESWLQSYYYERGWQHE